MQPPGQRFSPQPGDLARLWQAEAFGGLELLRAHFSGFSFSTHSHEETVIILTEGGLASPRFWRKLQWVGPGDIFVLQPGEVHSGGPVKGSIWRYRSFYLPVALTQLAARELTGVDREFPQFPEQVFHDPQALGLLRRAHIAMEEPASTLERETRLLEALSGLVQRHAVEPAPAFPLGREHRAVKLARERLDSLPGENVSLEDLAQTAGLSPFHFCRIFREETGLSPHVYQLQARVRLAKTLLAGGLPISQAALEAGFFDQAHLTRHFKRVFGVTPGRYPG